MHIPNSLCAVCSVLQSVRGAGAHRRGWCPRGSACPWRCSTRARIGGGACAAPRACPAAPSSAAMWARASPTLKRYGALAIRGSYLHLCARDHRCYSTCSCGGAVCSVPPPPPPRPPLAVRCLPGMMHTGMCWGFCSILLVTHSCLHLPTAARPHMHGHHVDEPCQTSVALPCRSSWSMVMHTCTT